MLGIEGRIRRFVERLAGEAVRDGCIAARLALDAGAQVDQVARAGRLAQRSAPRVEAMRA